MLGSKEGWATIWRMLFVHPEESNHKKAASVGFGVFMGIVPVWGFQLAIGIPLAILFRLNKTLFLLAANISIFPFTALILMASLATGKILLGVPWAFDWHSISLEQVKQDGLAFFLGGTVLSIVSGVTAYLFTYAVMVLARPRR
jgi:uncharacterized protein (DUF2062 family)